MLSFVAGMDMFSGIVVTEESFCSFSMVGPAPLERFLSSTEGSEAAIVRSIRGWECCNAKIEIGEYHGFNAPGNAGIDGRIQETVGYKQVDTTKNKSLNRGSNQSHRDSRHTLKEIRDRKIKNPGNSKQHENGKHNM